MSLQGFDESWYLNQKLADLASYNSEWSGRTVADLKAFLASVGMTPEQHYSSFGWQEGLGPNQYFNATEYLGNKAAQLVSIGVCNTVAEAQSALTDAWSGNLYQHYLQFGATEGIDPSDSFSTEQYLSDKLARLQSAGQADSSWTIDTVAHAIHGAGMTELTHWLQIGWQEGLTPSPSTDGFVHSDANSVVNCTVAELTGSAAPPAHYNVTDSFSAIDAHKELLDHAGSYSLTDADATDFGYISGDSAEMVQGAANFSHDKWQFDTGVYPVTDDDVVPMNKIAFIIATFADGTTSLGTGAVVSDNDVLTASHVVYAAGHGGAATSVKVIQGYNGESPTWNTPGAMANRINYYTVDEDGDGMMNSDESTWDIALLNMNTTYSSWFRLATDSTDGFYNMTGYPIGHTNSSGNELMTNDYGYATEDTANSVLNFNTLNAQPGNSGGPVRYKDGNTEVISGVVSTTGWATDVSNHLQTIFDWADNGAATAAVVELPAAAEDEVQLTGVAVTEVTVDVMA